MFRCPGQDPRYWKPDDVFEIDCPGCQRSIEFFKDEPARKCPGCGQRITNPRIDLGCAKWCQYAAHCIGNLKDDSDAAVCDKLFAAMKAVFGEDKARIDHATAVLEYAEAIQPTVNADALTVKAAAILHDIGIKKAEELYGAPSAKYQQIEGPPIARKIMVELELPGDRVEHVCRIIANHHTAEDVDTANTPEFMAVWDADWLVNLPDVYPDTKEDELAGIIEKTFRTEKGKQLATEKYLSNSN